MGNTELNSFFVELSTFLFFQSWDLVNLVIYRLIHTFPYPDPVKEIGWLKPRDWMTQVISNM